jgi:hypothetical protein
MSLWNTRSLFKFYLSKILGHYEETTYFLQVYRKERTPLISTKSNIPCQYKLSQREIIQLTLEGFRMLHSFKF